MTIPKYRNTLIQSCRAQIRCLKEKVQNETIYAYALLYGGASDFYGKFYTFERYEAEVEDISKQTGFSFDEIFVRSYLWDQQCQECFGPYYEWVDLYEAIMNGTAKITPEEMNIFDSEEGEEYFHETLKSAIMAVKDEINSGVRGCFADDLYISLQEIDPYDEGFMRVSLEMSKLMNSRPSHELHKRYWTTSSILFPNFLADNPGLA